MELKHCPFCWGKAEYHSSVETIPEIDENGAYVGCIDLVYVPHHGRLIDADALEALVIKEKYACAGASAYGAISQLHKSWGLHDAELMIEAAPTIIPADHIGDATKMVSAEEGTT